jgi:hypothetical protein
MTKRGRLSKEEVQYIESHADDSADDIAKALDRSVPIIEKYMEKQRADTEDSGPKAGDMLARNEKYGAVVMTENASMASDETKKKNEQVIATRYRGSIHKIKE